MILVVRRASGPAPGPGSPFFLGSAAMRPDPGAVDHLQHIEFAAAIGKCLQHTVADPLEAPAADRVPVGQNARNARI